MSTKPHFIRCIIPNEFKQPGKGSTSNTQKICTLHNYKNINAGLYIMYSLKSLNPLKKKTLHSILFKNTKEICKLKYYFHQSLISSLLIFKQNARKALFYFLSCYPKIRLASFFFLLKFWKFVPVGFLS